MNVFRRLARLPLRLPLFQLRHLTAPVPAALSRFTVAPIRAFAQFQRCSFSNAVQSNVIGTAVYVYRCWFARASHTPASVPASLEEFDNAVI
jgi:hypothetical protein